jgi:hypothetical protein
MRVQFYFRVVADELAIRELGAAVGLIASRTRRLRHALPSSNQPNEHRPSWTWETNHVTAETKDLDSAVRTFLAELGQVMPDIEARRPLYKFVSLVIVARVAGGADLQGIYLSAQAIEAIHGLGADLDIDYLVG